MAKRQCGQRKKGGVYAEVAESPNGMPLEYFIVDPPHVVDLAALGVTPRGVHLVEREGVWHIFDVVGQDNYPNVLDVIEEGRDMGFSRRCELPDYSRLGPNSRLILIHQRAMITNYSEYVSRLTDEQREAFECPIEVWMNRMGSGVGESEKIHDLDDLTTMCAGLWQYDVEGADIEGGEFQDDGSTKPRLYRKLEGGAMYPGWPRPEEIEPEYRYAIFMSLPLARLVVVNDPDDNTHEKKLEKARKGGLPVDLVEE